MENDFQKLLTFFKLRVRELYVTDVAFQRHWALVWKLRHIAVVCDHRRAASRSQYRHSLCRLYLFRC